MLKECKSDKQGSYHNILESCFNFNIRKAARSLCSYFDTSLDKVGITSGQLAILVAIDFLKGKNTTTISQYLGMDRTSFIRGVKILIKKNWVEFEGTSDRRVHSYHVTENGNLIIEKAIPVLQHVNELLRRNLKQYLTSDDCRGLLTSLDIVRRISISAREHR